MDTKDRDQTPGRFEPGAQPGGDSTAAKRKLPPPGTPAKDIVSICGWCLHRFGRLNVLNIERRDFEKIVIGWTGKDLSIFRGLDELYISDGICPDCRAREFPESPTGSGEIILLRTVLRLYLKTYADTQTHPTASQEAMVISAARAALEVKP